MNGLKFYSTCKQTSLPGTVSWIVAEDMSLLGHIKDFIAHGIAGIMSFIFMSVFLVLQVPWQRGMAPLAAVHAVECVTS